LLKHTFVGAVIVSSLSFAAPAFHPATPPVVAPPTAAGHRESPDRWQRGDDGFDAGRLLGEFERAAARRDVVRMQAVDARFSAFIDQELVDARVALGHGGFNRPGTGWARRTVEELTSLERRLGRLEGRVDRGAVAQKRALYNEVMAIAQRSPGGARRG